MAGMAEWYGWDYGQLSGSGSWLCERRLHLSSPRRMISGHLFGEKIKYYYLKRNLATLALWKGSMGSKGERTYWRELWKASEFMCTSTSHRPTSVLQICRILERSSKFEFREHNNRSLISEASKQSKATSYPRPIRKLSSCTKIFPNWDDPY